MQKDYHAISIMSQNIAKMWDMESIILSPFRRRGYKLITILHPPLCSLCHLKGWWFNCTICRSFEIYLYTRHMLICRTLCLPREIENEFLTSSTLPNVYFTNKTQSNQKINQIDINKCQSSSTLVGTKLMKLFTMYYNVLIREKIIHCICTVDSKLNIPAPIMSSKSFWWICLTADSVFSLTS